MLESFHRRSSLLLVHQAAVGGGREERLRGGGRGEARQTSDGPQEEVCLGRQAQVRSPGFLRRLLGPASVLKVRLPSVCRNLLCNLVRVKLSCYEMEKQCSLSVEDYLKAFLDTEVKPLWPKGWMQARWVGVSRWLSVFGWGGGVGGI